MVAELDCSKLIISNAITGQDFGQLQCKQAEHSTNLIITNTFRHIYI
jgi:hypothetical protein